MKTYTITLKLLSRAVIGSAEGYGAVIDKDIIFDEVGIPYIPARRIKGCLRDSAIEVLDMLSLAGINNFLDLTIHSNEKDKFKYRLLNELFGVSGMKTNSPTYFSNLFIPKYTEVRQWLDYFIQQNKDSREFISKDAVIAYYTDNSQQTAIDEDIGIAKKHSLRTVRSVRSGIEFRGEITVADESDKYERLLGLSALNLRSIGSMRTRGYGRVECEIIGINISEIKKTLEGLCIN